MHKDYPSSSELAASITQAASKQTYYTIRYLVDRMRIGDAYRAYAYFRWIDDQVDQVGLDDAERVAFIDRQKTIMESCYQRKPPGFMVNEEHMLAGLILSDTEQNSGLQAYIRNMMAVIDFDVRRKGRLISQLELAKYSQSLAVSVTEAIHYFIGHDQPPLHDRRRYLAVAGAHIAHLLRDTLEDIQMGYYNIPREYLTARRIGPLDVDSGPYQAWVQERVKLARAYFNNGKDYLGQLKNFRARIAGYAYIARFEGVLEALERQDYRLSPVYLRDKGLGAGMKMGRSVLSLALFPSARK